MPPYDCFAPIYFTLSLPLTPPHSPLISQLPSELSLLLPFIALSKMMRSSLKGKIIDCSMAIMRPMFINRFI